jgi:RNA-directed DNA polymerase
MHDKPKMLTGLNQNGTWSAAPPFDRAHTDSMTTGVQAGPKPRVVMFEEHGKPNTPPVTAGQPQGRLMAQWEKEGGESECRSVMVRIRVLPGAKASPLPLGLPWQESLRNRNQEECR